jgi:hypothetical protein
MSQLLAALLRCVSAVPEQGEKRDTLPHTRLCKIQTEPLSVKLLSVEGFHRPLRILFQSTQAGQL